MIWMLFYFLLFSYFLFFLFFFFFISFYFTFLFFFFTIGPQQTTPPSSVIATAAGRFRLRFVCPVVVGIRGRTRSYDPYGEEEGNLTQRGFIYNHFHDKTIRKFGGATHMRAGLAGNGKKTWRNTTTGRRDRVQGWLQLHYRSFGRVDWVFFFSVVISFAFVSFSHSLPFFAGQPGYVYRRESIDWILGWCSWAALGICLAVGGNTYIHLYACII